MSGLLSFLIPGPWSLVSLGVVWPHKSHCNLCVINLVNLWRVNYKENPLYQAVIWHNLRGGGRESELPCDYSIVKTCFVIVECERVKEAISVFPSSLRCPNCFLICLIFSPCPDSFPICLIFICRCCRSSCCVSGVPGQSGTLAQWEVSISVLTGGLKPDTNLL